MSTEPQTGPAVGLWRDGWYRYARRLDSPNFGARPEGLAIDLIVIHSISLPPGQYGRGHVQELFTNQLDWQAHPYFESIRGLQVSAHFLIARDGALWQFVACPARAWHAGRSHYLGRDNCNDNAIGIELEGVDDGLFEAEQYETLGSLCAVLLQAHPIEHLAGHEHVAPGRKQDPGPGFDWQRLQKALGLPDRCFPAGLP
ncbi:MAG: 1,6-anhydro-N-acetylmuramyl-L-alanine amidase AmpD [Betaproteobacteria bacterium]